jgi:hypothetical protein
MTYSFENIPAHPDRSLRSQLPVPREIWCRFHFQREKFDVASLFSDGGSWCAVKSTDATMGVARNRLDRNQ